jgi:tripartite-type tricarboxylate transporter receptor subunit TctC
MYGRRTLAMLAIACCATVASAQTYPSKPIKVIVPYTPGSPVDVLARVVTQQVSVRLGQSIVIDNRPGAGTTIGTKLAATADPDGYTLLIGATSFVLSFSLYPNLDYDPVKSFAPVAMLAYSPQVLVIAPSVPATTVREFVTYAKANPGQLNFGFGLGTLPHILGESFKAVTGTDIASIPYKGGAQAITDMLGGRIQMNFGTTATLLPLIQQGKVRALAVTTQARSKDLPDVPTMVESGLPELALTFSAARARRYTGRHHSQAQFRGQRSHEDARAHRQHGKARLRAANLADGELCCVSRRGNAALAADREGRRREAGIGASASAVSPPHVSTRPSADPEATPWP